eukprot:jgi/Mesen1/9228/ME000595S08642
MVVASSSSPKPRGGSCGRENLFDGRLHKSASKDEVSQALGTLFDFAVNPSLSRDLQVKAPLELVQAHGLLDSNHVGSKEGRPSNELECRAEEDSRLQGLVRQDVLCKRQEGEDNTAQLVDDVKHLPLKSRRHGLCQSARAPAFDDHHLSDGVLNKFRDEVDAKPTLAFVAGNNRLSLKHDEEDAVETVGAEALGDCTQDIPSTPLEVAIVTAVNPHSPGHSPPQVAVSSVGLQEIVPSVTQCTSSHSDVSKYLSLVRSATVPLRGQPSGASFNGEGVDSAVSYADRFRMLERSSSAPVLVSALKGGRSRPPGLRVCWAPDVWDPPHTSSSHTVGLSSRSRKSRKSAHSSRKRGDSSKSRRGGSKSDHRGSGHSSSKFGSSKHIPSSLKVDIQTSRVHSPSHASYTHQLEDLPYADMTQPMGAATGLPVELLVSSDLQPLDEGGWSTVDRKGRRASRSGTAVKVVNSSFVEAREEINAEKLASSPSKIAIRNPAENIFYKGDRSRRRRSSSQPPVCNKREDVTVDLARATSMPKSSAIHYPTSQSGFKAGEISRQELYGRTGHDELEQQTMADEGGSADRLVGAAALARGDIETAKAALMSGLSAAKLHSVKEEEARCLRLLADVQSGNQRSESLLAASERHRQSGLKFEQAEAIFCLGHHKLQSHLAASNQQHHSKNLTSLHGVVSAKKDFEQAARIILDHAFTQEEPESAMTSSGASESSMASVVLGSIYEAWGKACILLGEYSEAKCHLNKAIENENWCSAYESEAENIEALIKRLPGCKPRACKEKYVQILVSA